MLQRIKSLFCTLMLISLCTVIFVNIGNLYDNLKLKKWDSFDNNLDSLTYIINTENCKIINLNISDTNIKHFFTKVDPILCPGANSNQQLFNGPIILSNVSHIILNVSRFQDDLLINFSCCYQEFFRKEPNRFEYDRQFFFEDKCLIFNKTVEITDKEFIRISCNITRKNKFVIKSNKESPTYSTVNVKDFHTFVPKSKLKNRKPEENGRIKYNILLLGIDAVSRLNFIRQMPKSYNYLINNLEAIEMLGYNKIGDNTFPNLVAVLSGLSVNQLKSVCWKNDTDFFDNCPFIWKEFQKYGYITLFAEDASNIGLFQYEKKGFQKQPTDFYWNTMNLVSEDEIGYNKLLNAKLCLGSRLTYEVLFNYLLKFIKTTKLHKSAARFFALFWLTSITHDFLNFPQLIDNDFQNVLKELNELKLFDDTIMILISDHGLRWGKFRTTFNGFMEERLPFLYFILPKTFPENLKYNLLKNNKRLTTPYDLHYTLKDFLKLSTNFNQTLFNKNGQSLLHTIAENRTCSIANIEDHWCTCQILERVNISNKIIENIANKTIIKINDYIKNHKNCAPLKLQKILSAKKKTQNIPKNSKNNAIIYFENEYVITISVSPSNGIFESTFLHYVSFNTYNLVGPISRLNLYENQSNCLNNSELKLYCYCLNS